MSEAPCVAGGKPLHCSTEPLVFDRSVDHDSGCLVRGKTERKAGTCAAVSHRESRICASQYSWPISRLWKPCSHYPFFSYLLPAAPFVVLCAQDVLLAG